MGNEWRNSPFFEFQIPLQMQSNSSCFIVSSIFILFHPSSSCIRGFKPTRRSDTERSPEISNLAAQQHCYQTLSSCQALSSASNKPKRDPSLRGMLFQRKTSKELCWIWLNHVPDAVKINNLSFTCSQNSWMDTEAHLEHPRSWIMTCFLDFDAQPAKQVWASGSFQTAMMGLFNFLWQPELRITQHEDNGCQVYSPKLCHFFHRLHMSRSEPLMFSVYIVTLASVMETSSFAALQAKETDWRCLWCLIGFHDWIVRMILSAWFW